MKASKKLICILLATFIGLTAQLRADEKAVPNPFLGVLSATSSAELPAKAAELVSKATSKARSQSTVDVVKAAVGLNPSAASVIVGTIAQSSPEMAAIAAATAAGLVPDQADSIARAAAAAAPKQAGKIVEAICKVLPSSYKKVATAVAEVVPGAGKEILQGVAAALPALKTSINQILVAKGNTTSVSVGSALDQVVVQADKTDTKSTPAAAVESQIGMLAITPVVKPPFVNPVTTPGNIDPGAGGEVPTGGRDYAGASSRK